MTQIRSYCRCCEQETNHSVLAQKTESSRKEYSFDQTYQIVECLGCDTKSFRDVFIEIEHAYQVSDGEWEFPTSITVYPRFIKGHRSLNGDYHLPSLVSRIYEEVLLAFQEDALILAGLGLRGTVEAVCNDLGISGKSLEVRISGLADGGYISAKDAERLHGIRFMGNDAAHEIKKPKSEQLSVALKIVEHLLSSVYILDEEVNGKIETLITELSGFIDLMEEKVKHLSCGEELPVIGILGRDIRRVKESLPDLELELISVIDAGELSFLAKGKVDKYENSKHNLQHYVVA